MLELTQICPRDHAIGEECPLCNGKGLWTTKNGQEVITFLESIYGISSLQNRLELMEECYERHLKTYHQRDERQAKLIGIMSWLPHNQKTAERELIEALIEYIGNDNITAFFESLKKEMRWE